MGSLFGGLLAEHGLAVTLLARREEHVAAIRERGLRIVGAGGDRSVRLGAATSIEGVAPADVVLVQCKAHATREVCSLVAPLMQGGSVAVSFQNGLGNEETIAEVLGEASVLGGLTSLGATLEAPGVVRNYAGLPTVVGEMAGGLSGRAEALAALLTAHGITTQPSGDILADKWRKLMLNVAMSATSGLTGLTIGGVAAFAPLAAVARRAMDEAAAVAAACGVNLPQSTRYQLFDGIVASGAARNKTSMRRDIEAGRPSEVGAIYLSVIERGRNKGVPTATLEAFAALVQGLEIVARGRTS
jgi:2-dehydropantoate 2-reductase